jgi:hypothetical protein
MNGVITRNQCLSRFPAITRLSAIIQDLELAGYTFDSHKRDGDWVYTLVEAPKRPLYEYELVNGVRVPKLTYIPL